MIFHAPRLHFGLPRQEGDALPHDAFGDLPVPAVDVLVLFQPGTDAQGIAEAVAAVGGKSAPVHAGDEGTLLRVSPAPGIDVAQAITILSTQPGVSLAEPDHQVSIAAVSDDPTYTGGRLWNMYGDTTATVNAFGSQAGEAWARDIVGSTSSIVGVVDTGIDYRHVDLYLNIWLNQKEIPTALRSALADVDRDGLITFRDLNNSANAAHVSDINANGRIDAGDLLNDSRWENGADEDRNGYTDDLVGWDFFSNDNDPFDDNGHGTHVAGTIGAIGGNGVGVAGVAWNVQIAALKFLGANGSGATSSAIQAVDYFTGAASRAVAGENFVATNNSWGGGGYSQALADAVTRAARQDVLFVAAAGNGGGDGVGDNNDVTPNWPSNLSTSVQGFDAVISVASLTSTGALSSFSNYGRTSVDIAAPGSGIISTLPGDNYGTYSGTSMATPHVTGAAALYAALNPAATGAQIKAAILGTAAATPSASGLVATGGRLDVGALVGGGSTPTTPPPAPAPVADETAAITAITDNVGAFKGTVARGGTTDDATPTLTGTLSSTLESGESLAVYRNGAKVGTATWKASGSTTTWSFTEASPVADGQHSWSVRVEHTSGAVGTSSDIYSATIYTGPTLIFGTSASDALRGTSGADIISGVPASGSALGTGTRDALTGGSGNDIFVLGDNRGIFYNDGNAGSAGQPDYAFIADFARGDRIQLSDDVGAYFLASTRVGRDSGLGIYADLNGNGWFDTTDELIGIVSRVSSLRSTDFVFI